MALSATFTANFASFYDAVDKADAKLKDFGTGADKVGGRLDTLANQFSGRKIVQEATIMAKAVEDIGGVSKLTERELERLGSTANEAVAKMKALGMDVPKNLQEIADKTKGATQATTDWMGSLTKVAGAIGITFSLDVIKGFIGSVFDAAGAVKDLSDQWGVSTQFVQQWSAAAKQSGVEVEQLGKSIQYVTEKLSESSPEYEALLRNIGLSSAALRNMSTEDAYREIVTKIAGITDETLQLDVAMGILGPSAKKVIGGIRDGMYEAADAQAYMSKETIKRLEEAGDNWEKFKNLVVIYTGEMLGAVMKTTETMTTSWGRFFKYVAAGTLGGSGLTASLIQTDEAVDNLNKSLKGAVTTTETYTVAGQQLGTAIKPTAQILDDQRKKEEALKKAQEDRRKTLEDIKKREEEYIAGLRKHNDAILDLVNTFEGRDLIGKANLYLEALKDSIPVQQMTRETQDKINQVMVDAIKVYDAAGEDAPQALYDMWWATKQLASGTADYTNQLADADAALQKLIGNKFDPAQFGTTVSLGKAPKEAESFEKVLQDTAAAFMELGQAAHGSAGEILSATGQMLFMFEAAEKASKQIGKNGKELGGSFGPISTMFNENATGAQKWGAAVQSGTAIASGAMEVWASTSEAAGKGANTLHGAIAGAKAGAAFGPYGAAIGAAAGAIVGFVRSLNDGRQAVKEFAEAQGGFDALHAKLLTLGAAGEQMWIKLTQQTGKGDLGAAKEEIEKITAALGAADAALKLQAEGYALAIETAQKYGFTIEELGPAMARQELDKQAQQLYKDWEILNSAGLDTVLITEKMSKSVSEYVQHAMKMGTEIPDAMRPMLESMVKSGTLLDENGNAITDLEDAGISFSLSMSEGFKALIDQVSKLTDAISKSLGLAIKNVPDVKVRGEVTWDVKPVPAPPPPSSSGSQPVESYQGGTDGFRNFGTGTPVMLHGWEAVVAREESSSGAFATVSGAPVGQVAAQALAPSIVINAQGAFFDTPGDLQRLADRVNDALTAKFGLRNAMRAG